MKVRNLLNHSGRRSLVILLSLMLVSPALISQEPASYKNYKDLTTELKNLEKKNNIVTNLESIGQTNE